MFAQLITGKLPKTDGNPPKDVRLPRIGHVPRMASSVLKPEDGPWYANKEECAVEALLGAIEDGESGTDPETCEEEMKEWCARRDSNSRPNAPEAFALSS